MAQAQITINAVTGSDDDLPIATLVQLSNNNAGGELTFAWTIVDQPPGAADALSDPTIQNPTFTPNKEGTYLIRLVVNAGPNALTDEVVAAVRFLKSRQRVPSAGEQAEDGSRGWAGALGDEMSFQDALLNLRAGTVVAHNGSGGTRVRGEVVQLTADFTLKSGLPGQELIPSAILAGFATIDATNDPAAHGPLGIVESQPDGTTTIPSGGLMVVRVFGMFTAYPFGTASAAAVPLCLSDAGLLVEAAAGGMYQGRQVAVALSSGADFSLFFNGLGNIPTPMPLGFGSISQFAAGAADYYLPPGYDAVGTHFTNALRVPQPFAGVVYGLYWRARVGGTAPTTLVLQQNGSDTPLTLLLSGTSGSVLLTTPISVVEGDDLALLGRVTGAGSAYQDIFVSVGILPTRLIS